MYFSLNTNQFTDLSIFEYLQKTDIILLSEGLICKGIIYSRGARITVLVNFASWYYSNKVEEEFIFKPSTFRHGIIEADIRCAFERRMVDYAMPGEENKNLLLGLARDGSLLEVMYNVLDGNVINVFHAMKCRKAYHVLLRKRGDIND